MGTDLCPSGWVSTFTHNEAPRGPVAGLARGAGEDLLAGSPHGASQGRCGAPDPQEESTSGPWGQRPGCRTRWQVHNLLFLRIINLFPEQR